RASGNGISGSVVVRGRQRIGNQRRPVLCVIGRLRGIECFARYGRHKHRLEKLLSNTLELNVGSIMVAIVVQVRLLALHAGCTPNAEQTLGAKKTRTGDGAL